MSGFLAELGRRFADRWFALLPLSAALGLVAQGLAGPVERSVSGEWPRPFGKPATRLTARRAERWKAEHEAYETADEAADRDETAVAEAAARRNAIALVPPRRPTWTGDCLLAPGVRIDAQYGLDLPSLWTRLWLILASSSRRRLLALGAVWWPALVGLGAAPACHRRGRAAAEVYAELVEATVDVNLDRLVRRLGGEWPRRRGRGISERARKGT
jgi:hypothetical protein